MCDRWIFDYKIEHLTVAVGEGGLVIERKPKVAEVALGCYFRFSYLKKEIRSMIKSLCFFLFVTLLIISQPVNAGHDFMEALRQSTILIRKESCSDGNTKIERRLSETAGDSFLIAGEKYLMTVITVDKISNRDEFYTERHKNFYSTTFYTLSYVRDQRRADFFIKRSRSGVIEDVSVHLWFEEVKKADPNAAKSLTKQLGSDCKTTHEAMAR